MKRSMLAILILVLLCLCTACVLSPVEQYDNFLADLDIEMRIDMCIHQISEGNPSWYTRADVRTIQQDLQTLRSDNSDILAVNDLFLSSAKELENSISLLDSDQAGAAQESCTLAQEQFHEAQGQLHQLHEGGPSV